MSRSGIFQSLRRLVQAAHLADSLRISSRESLDLLTDRVGQVAENGGELIDNLHKTMLGLAREFDLQLEDVNKPDGEVFYNFFGQSYSEVEVVDDFRRFVPTIKDDLRGLSKGNRSHSDALSEVGFGECILKVLVTRDLECCVYRDPEKQTGNLWGRIAGMQGASPEPRPQQVCCLRGALNASGPVTI